MSPLAATDLPPPATAGLDVPAFPHGISPDLDPGFPGFASADLLPALNPESDLADPFAPPPPPATPAPSSFSPAIPSSASAEAALPREVPAFLPAQGSLLQEAALSLVRHLEQASTPGAAGHASFVISAESGQSLRVHLQTRDRDVRLRFSSASPELLRWFQGNWQGLREAVAGQGYTLRDPESSLS